MSENTPSAPEDSVKSEGTSPDEVASAADIDADDDQDRSLVDDISAAASKPGASASRNRILAGARRFLDSGHQDPASFDFHDQATIRSLIGRDQNTHHHYYSSARSAIDDTCIMSLLPPAHIERIRELFSEPQASRSAAEALQANHLLVLVQSRDCGTTTLGLWCLAECEKTSTYAISTVKNVESLERALRADSAYMFRTAPHDQFAGDVLDRLSAQLRVAGSYLVLCFEPNSCPPEILKSQYTFEQVGRPEAMSVAVKHYEVARKKSPSYPTAPQLFDSLKEHLDERVTPTAAVAVTRSMVEAISGGSTVAEAASLGVASLRVFQDQDLSSWFENQPSLDSRCFILALALLGGAPRELINSETLKLRSLIDPDYEKPSDIEPRRSPFATSSKKRLEYARATVIRRKRSDSPGSDDSVQFIDPTYPIRVLDLVWEEYPEIQPYLVEWMRLLGLSSRGDIGFRAAVAVGRLYVKAPDFFYENLIEKWGRYKSRDSRACAAVAIDESIKNGFGNQALKRVIDDGDAGTIQQAATAARCVGSILEVKGQAGAWDVMRELAKRGDPVILDAFCSAIADRSLQLMESQAATLPSLELEFLMELSRARDRSMQDLGQFGFLYLAADLFEDASRDAAKGTPLVLDLYLQSSCSHFVITLWAACLSSSICTDIARVILEAWAKAVEEKDEERVQLSQMLVAVASTGNRARAVVEREVHRWSNPRNSIAPRTSAFVLRYL